METWRQALRADPWPRMLEPDTPAVRHLPLTQAEHATKAVAEAGVADRVEIRFQDYRDVDDGPFDAVSSIGMFEHVGLANLGLYFGRLHALLRPGGRLLNHGISRPARRGPVPRWGPPRTPPRLRRNSFVDRYVFPDGELHEVGSAISVMQAAGFEARHVESCGSTTRSRCARGSRTSSGTGTRRSPRPARPAHGSGAPTWPRRP